MQIIASIIMFPFRVVRLFVRLVWLFTVMIVSFAVVLTGISLTYPSMNENTDDVCQALADRVIDLNYSAIGATLIGQNNPRNGGEVMRAYYKDKISDLVPPDLICGYAYMWSIVHKQDFVK